MTPEQFAQEMGVTTDEVFAKAYALYGLIFGTAGAVADHAWWKKWNTVPPYVTRYIREQERRKAAPVINA